MTEKPSKKEVEQWERDFGKKPLSEVELIFLGIVDAGPGSENYISAVAKKYTRITGEDISTATASFWLEGLADQGYCFAQTVHPGTSPNHGTRARRYYEISRRGRYIKRLAENALIVPPVGMRFA